jgi:uncharacterized RDD family membrane protein YckC
MIRLNLPSTEVRGAAWSGPPPDPLEDPELYDGIVWRRVGGYIVDVMAIAVLWIAAWIVLGTAAVMSLGLLLPLKVAVLALLPTIYHTWFLGSAGATPGMRLFDVELRSWTGRRPDYFQAFLQTVLFYTTISLTAFVILVVALFDNRGRTAHDFLAGTVGVRHSRIAPEAYHLA